MDENLQPLVCELRKETCPRRVRDEVARRISTQSRPSNRLRLGFVGVVAAFVLLGGVAVWRWPDREPQRPVERAESSRIQDVQVAQQAEGALGYMGMILLKAGAHSE